MIFRSGVFTTWWSCVAGKGCWRCQEEEEVSRDNAPEGRKDSCPAGMSENSDQMNLNGSRFLFGDFIVASSWTLTVSSILCFYV